MNILKLLNINKAFGNYDLNPGNIYLVLSDRLDLSIVNVINYFLRFLGFFVVIIFIYFGLRFVFSFGNEENQNKYKKATIKVGIGLVIIFLAYAIVQFGFILTSSNINTNVLQSNIHGFISLERNNRNALSFLQNQFNTIVQDVDRALKNKDLNYNDLNYKIEQFNSYIPSGNYKFNIDLQTYWNYVKDILSDYQNIDYNEIKDEFNFETSIIRNQLSNLQFIHVDIDARPNSGSAPLHVEFSALNSRDPNGLTIPYENYIWWYEMGNKKIIIGRGPVISHTFNQSNNYQIHCTIRGYQDGSKIVLDGSAYVSVKVEPSPVQLIVRINNELVDSNTNLYSMLLPVANKGVHFSLDGSRTHSGANFQELKITFGSTGKMVQFKNPPFIIEPVIFDNPGIYEIIIELTDTNRKRYKRVIALEVKNIDVDLKISSQDSKIIKESLEEFILTDPTSNYTFLAEVVSTTGISKYTWKIRNNENKIIEEYIGKSFTTKFEEPGRYELHLEIMDNLGFVETKYYVVNVESLPPNINLDVIQLSDYQNNYYIFDASKTYNVNNVKLFYNWYINEQKISLQQANENESKGIYVFNNPGKYELKLEVSDIYGNSSRIIKNINIDFVLPLNITLNPPSNYIGEKLIMNLESRNATNFKIDFGDGTIINTENNIVEYQYDKIGNYKINVSAYDVAGNIISKTINYKIQNHNYPIAIYDIKINNFEPNLDFNLCGVGKHGYTIYRTDNVLFDASNSLNTNFTNNNLSYKWIIGDEELNQAKVAKRFSKIEPKCVEVFLEVRNENGKQDITSPLYLKVINQKPILGKISVYPTDNLIAPTFINVKVIGSKDFDGFISHYIFYYKKEYDDTKYDLRLSGEPQTIFKIPIQGHEGEVNKYEFFVDIVDNDNAITKSEDVLQDIPSVNIRNGKLIKPDIIFTTNKLQYKVGEPVEFTVKVYDDTNTDITNMTNIKIDFYGDGIYNKENISMKEVYIYKQSGIYEAKVEIEYNNIITHEILKVEIEKYDEETKADFEYVIFDKTVFFINKSLGFITDFFWIFENEELNQKEPYIIFEDYGKHEITLNVVDGEGKKDSITKKINIQQDNVPDYITFDENKDLQAILVGVPEFIKNEGIFLTKDRPYIKLYLDYSQGNIKNYLINSNINLDISGDGNPLSDIDNKNDDSYKKGGVYTVYYTDNNITDDIVLRFTVLDYDDNEDFIDIKVNIVDDIDDVQIEPISNDIDEMIDMINEILTNLVINNNNLLEINNELTIIKNNFKINNEKVEESLNNIKNILSKEVISDSELERLESLFLNIKINSLSIVDDDYNEIDNTNVNAEIPVETTLPKDTTQESGELFRSLIWNIIKILLFLVLLLVIVMIVLYILYKIYKSQGHDDEDFEEFIINIRERLLTMFKFKQDTKDIKKQIEGKFENIINQDKKIETKSQDEKDKDISEEEIKLKNIEEKNNDKQNVKELFDDTFSEEEISKKDMQIEEQYNNDDLFDDKEKKTEEDDNLFDDEKDDEDKSENDELFDDKEKKIEEDNHLFDDKKDDEDKSENDELFDDEKDEDKIEDNELFGDEEEKVEEKQEDDKNLKDIEKNKKTIYNKNENEIKKDENEVIDNLFNQ